MAEFIQHTVENNETLRSLAVKYNTTTANLAQINHITSTAYIFPGMQLKVPNIGLKISSIEFSTQNLKLTESAQNLLTTSQNEKLVDVGSGTAGTSTAKNATDSTTSASSQPLTSSNSDKSSQHLSDILNVNFSTSLPTTSNFLKKNMSESEAQTRQKSQNAPSHEQPPSANQQLMTENAGFIKLQAVLLPADIKGTLIITNSALMFDPLDDNLRKFSNITALEETSWIECVRVPKATQTSQKLEEQFPMVNSIMRSFSDYFEESNDSSFDFILMKLSMDLSKSIDFTYFKVRGNGVFKIFRKELKKSRKKA